jgi:hypothetical protein
LSPEELPSPSVALAFALAELSPPPLKSSPVTDASSSEVTTVTVAAAPEVGLARPGTHPKHASFWLLMPSNLPKKPGGHGSHSTEPSEVLKKPRGQGAHFTAPSAEEKFPAPHGRHPISALDALVKTPKVPAGHGSHFWPFTPSAYEPSAQGTHAVMPGSGAMNPGAHETHAATPSVFENDPAGQRKHASFETAFLFGENVDDGHEAHSVAPKALWNVPGGHSSHTTVAF